VYFDDLDVIARLGLATLLGALIGVNRDLKQKPMGSRTLGLVALGAAAASVAALQVPGMSSDPNAMSRVVQGILQGIMGGISFIGAGVILRDPRSGSVDGLTTAATVWVTAALGIACALAAWRVAAIATALVLILLLSLGVLRWFGIRSN
jgi:putative Mg2+ transporter-C (MgtC) family protein